VWFVYLGRSLTHPCSLSQEKEGEVGVLLDVNSLSLGIETTGGIMSTVIPRNTQIPMTKTKIFSTSEDNQEMVIIKVYEGERELTKGNNLLGKFELKGIPPAPKGVPKIAVTFEIDANGILRVSALDKGSGNKETITVTSNGNGRLTEEEINRMVAEAEEYSKRDRADKERIEARNGFVDYVLGLRNQLHDPEGLGGELSRNDKETVSSFTFCCFSVTTRPPWSG